MNIRFLRSSIYCNKMMDCSIYTHEAQCVLHSHEKITKNSFLDAMCLKHILRQTVLEAQCVTESFFNVFEAVSIFFNTVLQSQLKHSPLKKDFF